MGVTTGKSAEQLRRNYTKVAWITERNRISRLQQKDGK